MPALDPTRTVRDASPALRHTGRQLATRPVPLAPVGTSKEGIAPDPMTLATASRRALLALSLLPASASATGTADPEVDALAEMPIGYAALAIERAAGVDVAEAAGALDRVVESARSTLPAATAREALQAIADAARLACPQLVDDAGDGLISGALREGRCDCDILVVAYLTVADVLDLPLSAVFLPGHALVVWEQGPDRIYWETTVPAVQPAWYVEALVPAGAERAYLRRQTRRDLIGYFFQVRAGYRLGAGDAAGALADYGLASRLNPTSPLVAANRGRAHLLTGHYPEALADYEAALRLDPEAVDAVYGRGLALLALGRPADALGAFAEAVRLDGEAADVAHARGLAHAALGDPEAALEQYDAALRLDPSLALAYEARGAVLARLGEADRARQDYLAFLRLAPGTPHADAVPEVRARLEQLGPETAAAGLNPARR